MALLSLLFFIVALTAALHSLRLHRRGARIEFYELCAYTLFAVAFAAGAAR
jgi:hypothetical protein